MKAKDYYEKYHTELEDTELMPTALANMALELFYEVPEIMKIRHATSDSSFLSTMKEVDNKYKAICRMFKPPVLLESSFKELINNVIMPEIKGRW